MFFFFFFLRKMPIMLLVSVDSHVDLQETSLTTTRPSPLISRPFVAFRLVFLCFLFFFFCSCVIDSEQICRVSL